MRGHHRSLLVTYTLLTGALAAQGCAKGGAAPGLVHPALTPAETNRDRLVARVLVPSLDRTSATVDELRERGAMPFGAAELRAMLLARLRLPEDAVKLVDTGRPISFALVAMPAATSEPRTVMAGALALRAPEGAGAFVDALGKLVGSDRDVLQLRREDGEPIWILRVGQTMAWANTREALVEAGAHALDARADAADDLLVTAYPGPWARTLGADLSGGHQILKQRLIEELDRERERPRPLADRAALDAVLDFVLRPLPETDLIDVRLGLGRERGAQLQLRAQPRPGTGFAGRTAARHPYSLENAAPPPAAARLGAVVALGDDPAYLDLLASVIETQGRAGLTGAAATGKRVRGLVGRLTGAMFGSLQASGNDLSGDLLLSTRSPVAPSALLDELAGLVSDAEFPALLRHLYRVTGPVRAGRDNDRLRAEVGPDLTVLAAAAPGRLMLATEPGGSERLSVLAGARGGTAAGWPPAVQAALEESRGRDGLVFVDGLALLGPLLSASGAGSGMVQGLLSMPGLAGRQLPIWLSFGGGAALALELRLPLESLTTAAGLLRFSGS
jgi:hypothetical protein